MLTEDIIRSAILSIFKIWELSQRFKNLGQDHTASKWRSQQAFELSFPFFEFILQVRLHSLSFNHLASLSLHHTCLNRPRFPPAPSLHPAVELCQIHTTGQTGFTLHFTIPHPRWAVITTQCLFANKIIVLVSKRTISSLKPSALPSGFLTFSIYFTFYLVEKIGPSHHLIY